MSHDQQQVKERFETAIERLVARLEEDTYVLAAVLYGSVARGEPWERSDIDLVVILRDDQERAIRNVWLVEDDINVSAELITRGRFKRGLESELQGGFTHSVRSQYRLLFSKDDTITAWLSEPPQIGKHDQQLQLLRTASAVFWTLDKAEKWFTVKHDLNYSVVWILHTVNTLARVEVLLNGVAPGREALDQALTFNPDFFQAVYVDLINGPKTPEQIGAVLNQINTYLEERTRDLFEPVLVYLSQANGPCTATEMNDFFKKKAQTENLGSVYEWLARKGIIQKLSSPVHLTRKSQVTLNEPAYYYDEVDLADWE